MAQSTEEKGPVTFLSADGEEISNDPVWHAKKTLEQAGQPFAGSQPEEQQARLRQIAAADDDNLGDDDDTEEAKDDAGNRTYAELDAKGVKKEATDRGVDIKGLKKVGEVREALIAADTAQRELDAAGNGDNGSAPKE